MKVAILQANLGGFDMPKDPVQQDIPVTFHRFTDENFPPIADLPGRFQYRIPKLFGWQMFPGYDYYIWLDGSISFLRPDCATYYLDQLGEADFCFFKHPNRSTIKDEVAHIDDYVNRRKGTKKGQEYMIRRYGNGLHKEALAEIQRTLNFTDDKLYASTTFIYRNNYKVHSTMKKWWYWQSRYYTCDQVPLPYCLQGSTYYDGELKVNTFDQPIFKTGYMSLVSQHA